MEDTNKKTSDKKNLFDELNEAIKEVREKNKSFVKRTTPTEKDLAIVFNI